MNPTNISELKNYFRARGLKPKDYMGQNFLIDEDALKAIVEAADLKSSDIALEVGPGLGVLTKQLAEKCKEVWAVEKDAKLVQILKTKLHKENNIHLINDDILRFHVDKHIKGDYKVVANIPYYLTSKLLQNFLELNNPPKLMVLMIQKEVGERVVAKAGELSVLGISVQIYSDPEIVAVQIPDQVRDGFGEKRIPLIVPKTSFWPVPKVDSVILRIIPKNKYPEIQDKKLFFQIVKTAFAGKRKQIHNTLKNLEALNQAGIDPKTRPQDITIEKWIRLYLVLVDRL
ncbi:MAG: hypothetical protein A2660_02130 [Candidatus Doudnabacteria bacterium RIFCSPHIGHO2_01_FULL_45_18]|uniref:Ribosomal RNA small subunit methyltransferase A n=1 Tax=Candidatus Doudnabacteria bacterium RIFCSPHIGHO2_01_FULL_45_18 TaxID=1817823 RepID=A0A1F5NSQ4_9BACT|nr:MAG: hypothetical protein A2660_02130 [Candidatus Doudnabacteria bacterium RIFCSPHIGHO2_01_FULL_45_18]